MRKLILQTCKIYNQEKTTRGFSRHIIKSHNIKLIGYINCFYTVSAERIDGGKLMVEVE